SVGRVSARSGRRLVTPSTSLIIGGGVGPALAVAPRLPPPAFTRERHSVGQRQQLQVEERHSLHRLGRRHDCADLLIVGLLPFANALIVLLGHAEYAVRK